MSASTVYLGLVFCVPLVLLGGYWWWRGSTGSRRTQGLEPVGEVAVESFGGRPARLRLFTLPVQDGHPEQLVVEVRGRGITAWQQFTLDLDREQAQCLIAYLQKALAAPGAPPQDRRRNSPMRAAWVRESRRWYADDPKS